MRSKLFIILFGLLCTEIVFNYDRQDQNMFNSDPCGYYAYLPAIFIYNDLDKLDFYNSIDSTYKEKTQLQYAISEVNGKILNKYPAGVAFFELPLFLVAHVCCKYFHSYPADGFSLPYQLAGLFSTILWVVAGLWILRGFLKRYFNDTVTTITLLLVALGTNLYVYTAFVQGMSHPYSFFLFACLLSLTGKWYTKPGLPLNILIGLTLGFIFIVRPTNIIAGIIPLLWGVNSLTSLKERAKLLAKQYKNVLMILVVFSLVVFIQCYYWHHITGHWIYYSYNNEGFDFMHPNIIKGLFSYRKGWFVYTPMALLGMLGIYYLYRTNKQHVPALLVFFACMIYVTFSWREWWYGGGFGCRPLVESYAVMALPLAAMTQHFSTVRGIWKRVIYFTVVFSFVALNIFQSYQYSMGLIHWSRMTKEYYWRVFGRVNFDRVKNEPYLIKESEQYNR